MGDAEAYPCERSCLPDVLYCINCVSLHLPCHKCMDCPRLGNYNCQGCHLGVFCEYHRFAHEENCDRIVTCSECDETMLYASKESRPKCSRCMSDLCRKCNIRIQCSVKCDKVFCNRPGCGDTPANLHRHQRFYHGCKNAFRCSIHDDVVYKKPLDRSLSVCFVYGCSEIACPKCVPNYTPDGTIRPAICKDHQAAHISDRACPCCKSRFLKRPYITNKVLISTRLFKGLVREIIICGPCYRSIKTGIDCIILLYRRVLPPDIIEQIVIYTTKK